jgi:hypothetical protein
VSEILAASEEPPYFSLGKMAAAIFMPAAMA